MVTTKQDLIDNQPTTSDYIQFASGDTVDANTTNDNNNNTLAFESLLFNFCIDQSPQTGQPSTYTALQDFQAGIKTDSIVNSSTNGNIALNTSSGTGIVTAQDATYGAGQVLTTANINVLAPSGGVAVMTGATSGADGTQGLAPKPIAGDQNKALLGSATYSPVIRSTVDTLNTGAMAAGKSFVGTGANATAPDYVVTVDAALDLTGTPSSGQIPIASSASAAFWTTATADTFNLALACQGRLTLTSGSPIVAPTTSQTAKTSVFFTPYGGNRIALYNGTNWIMRAFSEISVAVPATTTTPFDIFAYDNAGTVALETTNWTNDTTRATALTFQNGVYVKSGTTTRRYLGTCRTTGVSGQTQVTTSSCLLWNYYNRIPTFLTCQDTTASWTYTTAAWQAANASTTVGTSRVEVIIGVTENLTSAINGASAGGSNGGLKLVGVGVNSVTVNSAQITYGCNANDANFRLATSAVYKGFLAVGYNYIQRLETVETASGTVTWIGQGASLQANSAMVVDIWA